MKLVNVKSSMLRRVGYDEETRELEVVFRTGERYRYENVPASKFKDLLEAESIGAFMQENIINVFPYRRLEQDRKT